MKSLRNSPAMVGVSEAYANSLRIRPQKRSSRSIFSNVTTASGSSLRSMRPWCPGPWHRARSTSKGLATWLPTSTRHHLEVERHLVILRADETPKPLAALLAAQEGGARLQVVSQGETREVQLLQPEARHVGVELGTV